MNYKTKTSFLTLTMFIYTLFFLIGCDTPIAMNPKGPIGMQEMQLVKEAILLMLIVVIPVIFMTFLFAWKYRSGNKQAKYTPDFHHSSKIEIVVWTVPVIIITILALITWKTTHELDPYKPIVIPNKNPITIEVVALDWKWLFIYPEQNIASVNFVQFPIDTPINFKITADAPMNGFHIQQLGTQVYAMAGMQTQLHLVASEVGNYFGRSTNYSGHGFSGMQFVAKASSETDFNLWVNNAKQSANHLSADEYKKLSLPSEDNQVKIYSQVQPQLYKNIIMKFMMPGMDDLSEDHSDMHM